MRFFIGLVAAFLITVMLVPLVKRFAFAVGAVDKPSKEARKIHRKTIARGGGVAIYLSFVLVCIALLTHIPHQFVGLLVAGTIVLVIGFLDDIYRLSPWIKLAGQVIAALIATIGFGIGIDSISNPFGNTFAFDVPNAALNLWGLHLSFNTIAVGLAVLWLVAMTNTINFLDGIDGLSGGVSAIAAGIIFLLSIGQKVNQPETALVAIILMGGCLGYLIYNFYPAKIFNGDSGAYFLGMTLGILAIFSGAKLATAALVLGLPILDAMWAIFRRLIHGKSPFTPDRGHLHYLFLDAGFSQRQTVLCIYVLCLAFGCAGLLTSSTQKLYAIAALVVVMVLLLIGLAYLKKRRGGKPTKA